MFFLIIFSDFSLSSPKIMDFRFDFIEDLSQSLFENAFHCH